MGHWNECGYRVENPSVDTGISSTCDRLHSSTEAGAVGNAKLVDGSFKMLAQVLLIATLPSMFCAGCATFLAYKERKHGSGSPVCPSWPASAALPSST